MPYENPQAPQRLQYVSLGSLKAKQFPKRDFLLSPWLREQESVMLWAAPGVGKTMFSMTLALAIAGGGAVLGWTAPAPRKVILVDGEMASDDIQARLVTLQDTVSGLDVDAADRNLIILARHAQDPDVKFWDFADEEQHDHILAKLRREKPDLVIIDNLSTVAAIDDENDAAKMHTFVRFLMRLKQAKIACLVIHHANKSGSGFRGSSMLATTFEVIMGMKKEKGRDVLDPAGTTRFHMVWEKYRGLRDSTIGDRAVTLSRTDNGDLEWAFELPQDEVLETLAALVRSGLFTNQVAVGKALPERFWPTQGKPPSEGWINGRFKLAITKGIITDKEVAAHFEAAREEADPDDDL
ncbi:MAG: AAA family ATPase [Asticcacaulis sp.]|uniref:AAA family ATPase n=1 Tax=Asticcacaulis sp. TaxID=1872648 RepID=UPI003F7B6A4E